MDALGTDFTSYKDLRGIISLDFPGDLGETDFNSYIESININTKKYAPIGIEVVGIEMYDQLEEAEVRVIAYDLGNEKQVVRLKGADTFGNFLKNVYRLSITVTEEGYSNNSKLKLDRDIEEGDY